MLGRLLQTMSRHQKMLQRVSAYMMNGLSIGRNPLVFWFAAGAQHFAICAIQLKRFSPFYRLQKWFFESANAAQ